MTPDEIARAVADLGERLGTQAIFVYFISTDTDGRPSLSGAEMGLSPEAKEFLRGALSGKIPTAGNWEV